ncbi:MAG: glycoside hydrolase family 9 protein [Ruminococcus sp.]|nr:glycoside hydrolase family 9 protein [Ruminococcus sp.]
MNRKFKAITGSLMAVAMLASSAAVFAVPVTADAGQLLGQTDFEDGVGIPWHTCETEPARQHCEITDGKYFIHIDNPDGADARWDLQFRHRGLKILEGHTYTLQAEIKTDSEGYIYSRIGDYSGNYDYWHDLGDGEWTPHHFEAGETLKLDTSFTATNVQDGYAEWTFQYANNNGWSNMPDTGMPFGATIEFDNMSLIDESGSEADFDKINEFGIIRPQSNVRLNQVGYYEKLAKVASYVTDASEPLTFHIYDANDKEVYTNTASKVIKDDYDSGTPEEIKSYKDGHGMRYKDSGKYVQILDFTEFITGGADYYIVVDDEVGVSGTRSGNKEGAFDTTIEDGKVMWTNWKTGVSYQMNKSHPFNIAKTVYDGLLRDSMNYFYQNRSGCKVEASYISSGDKSSLCHDKYGHNPDTGYVQPNWVKYYTKDFDGEKEYSVTATGGWYDAGNHCKSVINGGSAVWTLQNMYEMSKKFGTDAKWTDGKTMLVPEGVDKVPDVLDEARYELDWMFDMIVKPEDPYFGEDTGMVYHKMQDHRYTGLAIHAWIYEGYDNIERIIKPPTYAATFNMIACAAQASRLWEEFDPEYAAKCLENAETSLAAVEKYIDKWNIVLGLPKEQDYTDSSYTRGNDVYFAPMDHAISSAAYGDSFVVDDYYWALCELYATTGKEEYYEKLKKYKNPNDPTGMDKAFSLTTNLSTGENYGSFSSFNRGCTAGYGTLSLYLNTKEYVSAEDYNTISDNIIKAADNYLAEEDKQGMGIPYREVTYEDQTDIGLNNSVSGYEFYSNSYVVNNAIVMAYACMASTNGLKYLDGASLAMDYIFGRNGNDFSYVSGYGDVALQYPHHKLWAHGVDDEFPMAPAGVLSGGPCSGMTDPYIGSLGYRRGTVASQKCYVDNAEAWSVNEVSVQWNASLAWMTAFLQDIGPIGPPHLCPPTDPVPTEPATKGETPGVSLWGDANEDNKVTVADAVAALQYICNQTKYALTDLGLANADVVDHGKGITGDDAIAIQKIDAGLIKSSYLPVTSSELKNFK